ncbi:hypothetical protein HK405_012604, partial [Cladochytrium tenue]
AIRAGYSNVEAATDFILETLAGRAPPPSPPRPGPALVLRPPAPPTVPSSDIPASQQQQQQQHATASASSPPAGAATAAVGAPGSSAPGDDVAVESSTPLVKSRYRESRKDYADLVAKKELEAAVRRKQLDKDSKRRVLEQIREDREMQKLRRVQEQQQQTSTAPPQPTQAPPQQQSASAVAVSHVGSRDSAEAALQIRLPSGQALRTRFLTSATLADVFAFVESSTVGAVPEDRAACSPGSGYSLVVPFPRRVLASDSDEIRALTVGAAGFAPSASLSMEDPSEEGATEERGSEHEGDGDGENGSSENEGDATAENNGDHGVRFADPRRMLPWGGTGRRLAQPENENDDNDDGDGGNLPARARPGPRQMQPGIPPFFGALPHGRMGPIPFEGPGHRIVTNSPARTEEEPRQVELTGDARVARLSAISRAVAAQPRRTPSPAKAKPTRNVQPLLVMALGVVVGLIRNPEVPSKVLASLKWAGSALGERILRSLAEKGALDNFCLNRIRV